MSLTVTAPTPIHPSTRRLKRLTDAQRDVAARFFEIAEFVAVRFARQWRVDADECVSQATHALFTAARCFDPSRGIPMEAYVGRLVWLRLNGLFSKGRLRFCVGRRRASADAQILLLSLENPEHPLLAREAPANKLDEAMEVLTPRERWVVTMRVRGRMSHRRIAGRLSAKPGKHSQYIYAVATRKMRAAFGPESEALP